MNVCFKWVLNTLLDGYQEHVTSVNRGFMGKVSLKKSQGRKD